jgi:DNA-binding NarL/FixJ family response regulator
MKSDRRDPGESTIRVLVAANSRVHTSLLADALKRDPVLDVIPCESDSSGIVNTAISGHIDVLLISSNLDEEPCRGIEVLRELHARRPATRAVLLLDSSKDETVVQAFRSGAWGVFGRNEPMEMLGKCVKSVYQGQYWANNRDFGVLISALANSPSVRAVNADGMNLLSERELQVVQCLAEGLTNREIAERLHLSKHTVKNYFFKIFDKLGVSSRVELLFMSLSRSPAEQPLSGAPHKDGTNGDYSHSESDMLRKSAEAGVPAAQLALAQMYLTRRSDPQDLVEAYMWYLVATERALQARAFFTKMLTPQQIDEAKERAAAWLSGRKGPQPSASFLSHQAKRFAAGSEQN